MKYVWMVRAFYSADFPAPAHWKIHGIYAAFEGARDAYDGLKARREELRIEKLEMERMEVL